VKTGPAWPYHAFVFAPAPPNFSVAGLPTIGPSNNCSQMGGKCTNTVGSYVCACDEGYVGDGFVCTSESVCVCDTGPLSTSCACLLLTYPPPGRFGQKHDAGSLRPILRELQLFDDVGVVNVSGGRRHEFHTGEVPVSCVDVSPRVRHEQLVL